MKFGEVTLAEECQKCDGRGYFQPKYDRAIKCFECDGKGKILTGDGESLKEFFEKFVKVNVTMNLRSEVKAE